MANIQALTWQAKAPKQQDSLLITNGDSVRVIQHKALISNEYHFETDFVVAVADGIASSPYSGQVSKKLLERLAKQFHTAISFNALQDDLNNHFTQKKYQGAGSTLAMAYYHTTKSQFEIRHLGDSRVYYFNGQKKEWRCLTTDHTYLNELKKEQTLDENKEYASSYDILYHYFCIESENTITYFEPQFIQLNQGDYLLLCTDGVHDVLSCENWLLPNELSLKEWLMAMQKLLQKNHAYDNMTMILIEH